MEVGQNLFGGAKEKKSKKEKVKKSGPKRSLPPALVEFGKLRKFIADKIGKNGKPAMIIASKLKKAAEAKLPGADMAKWVAEAKKMYEENPSKWKSMM